MKQLFLFLFFCLSAMPVLAQAQNPAVVTGTLVDPNGVAFYPATVTACLTPFTPDPIVNGLHVNASAGSQGNYCPASVSTASNGFFSMTVFPNAAITPSATQYQFTVNTAGAAPPSGKGPQTYSVTVTISGTSQDVSASLNAAATALLNSSGGGGGIAFTCSTADAFLYWLTATTGGCDSGVLTNGSGGFSASASIAVGTLPASCGAATGVVCMAEGSVAGTPTAGQDYMRADSTTHTLQCSYNGAAEAACSAASGANTALSNIASVAMPDGSKTAGTLSFTGATAGSGLFWRLGADVSVGDGTNDVVEFGNGGATTVGLQIGMGKEIGFSSGSLDTTAADTFICRSGSGILSFGITASCSNTNALLKAVAFETIGTRFTATGCTSITTPQGGATAGRFTIGANSCTVVITMNGATGLTANNGYSCHANDKTTPAGNTGLYFSANNTTTATLTVPASAVANDVIDFGCDPF